MPKIYNRISYTKYNSFEKTQLFTNTPHQTVSRSMNYLMFSIIFDVLERYDAPLDAPGPYAARYGDGTGVPAVYFLFHRLRRI